MGGFSITMGLAWVFEGRKLFRPPVNDEAFLDDNEVIIAVEVDPKVEEQGRVGKSPMEFDSGISK